MKYKVKDRDIYISSGLVVVSWTGSAIGLALIHAGLPIRLLIGLVPVVFFGLQV
jgi:hypothetical protein